MAPVWEENTGDGKSDQVDLTVECGGEIRDKTIQQIYYLVLQT